MIVALVAEGPNSVRIPALFWSDYDTALTQVTEILGKPTQKNHWTIWCEHYFYDEEKLYFFIGSKKDYNKAKEAMPKNPDSQWVYGDPAWKEWEKAKKDWYRNLHFYLKKINPAAIFTRYYGGCGECGGFSLETYEEGKPCVQFNLD